MTLPALSRLYDVVDQTWPAAATTRVGPWTIRKGRGGGSRVSAATATGPVLTEDIVQAETAMQAIGQKPLFSIRAGDDALDAQLANRGYIERDVTIVYAAPVAAIATQRPPPVTSFEVWPPLQSQIDIWAAGGIGADRVAVMERAPHPKTSLLGRLNDRPAGTTFICLTQDCAMIHALEIANADRRQGLAGHMTRAAAFWAQSQGADYLTLVTTQANIASNRLYASLGMTVVGQYHYRTQPET